MKHTLETVLRVLGQLAIVAMIGVGLLTWNANRPPFDLSRLEQLQLRMTTNDVQRVLGKPSSAWIRTNESGQSYSEWAYARLLAWPIVYVCFKPDGTFESHRYDH